MSTPKWDVACQRFLDASGQVLRFVQVEKPEGNGANLYELNDTVGHYFNTTSKRGVAPTVLQSNFKESTRFAFGEASFQAQANQFQCTRLSTLVFRLNNGFFNGGISVTAEQAKTLLDRGGYTSVHTAAAVANPSRPPQLAGHSVAGGRPGGAYNQAAAQPVPQAASTFFGTLGAAAKGAVQGIKSVFTGAEQEPSAAAISLTSLMNRSVTSTLCCTTGSKPYFERLKRTCWRCRLS